MFLKYLEKVHKSIPEYTHYISVLKINRTNTRFPGTYEYRATQFPIYKDISNAPLLDASLTFKLSVKAEDKNPAHRYKQKNAICIFLFAFLVEK